MNHVSGVTFQTPFGVGFAGHFDPVHKTRTRKFVGFENFIFVNLSYLDLLVKCARLNYAHYVHNCEYMIQAELDNYLL